MGRLIYISFWVLIIGLTLITIPWTALEAATILFIMIAVPIAVDVFYETWRMFW